MNISIVCVNYNSYEKLNSFLLSLDKALLKCKGIELFVYIADNSNKKENFDVNVSFPYKIFDYNNLGYFGGAFAIINSERNEINKSDFTIISNVDLQVDENFFADLTQAKIDLKTAWIAPQIYSNIDKSAKTYRIKFNRPSKKRILFLLFSFKFFLIQKIYRKTFFKNKKGLANNISQDFVYSGHGSFIVLTKVFFEAYKNEKLYYEPFLYCEENFLAELILEKNLKVEYIPSLLIYDDEHVSTGKLPSKTFFKYNYKALKYIYTRFYKKN